MQGVTSGRVWFWAALGGSVFGTCRVWGLGFRVMGFGFRVYGFGFRASMPEDKKQAVTVWVRGFELGSSRRRASSVPQLPSLAPEALGLGFRV